MQVKKQQLGPSRRTSQDYGWQKGSAQGLSPLLRHPPILLRDSGTSRALLGVRLGTVALDACLLTPTSDKTVLDFTRIRLAQRRVHRGSLNWLDLAGCRESQRSMRGITTERLSRDQALRFCSGSTDSKTLDYQRTNPTGYQNSENSHKGNHCNKRPSIPQPPAAPCAERLTKIQTQPSAYRITTSLSLAHQRKNKQTNSKNLAQISPYMKLTHKPLDQT